MYDFKVNFYATVFSIFIVFSYKINIVVFKNFTSRGSFITNNYFLEAIGLIIVALNSSHSQKSSILAFTFDMNPFLSSRNNGSNFTDYDVFVLLNVTGLPKPNQISDKWLDVNVGHSMSNNLNFQKISTWPLQN